MKTSRCLFALLTFVVTLQSATLQDDTAKTLARAQALYYEARFKESIDLLLPLDTALRSQPQRLPEKIDIKLQLALAHIGLSDVGNAKTRFSEICALDPTYSLDPQRFAPKVISLFEDAKVDAAAHFYQQGVDAYKKNDAGAALDDFRTATKFQPEHQLARSYIELIQNQLRVSADRSVLEWRAAFEGRDFAGAVATYRRLEAANVDGIAKEALEKIRGEYRQHLSPVIESSKRACSTGDAATMLKTRREAEQMLPDPIAAREFLAEMETCAKKDCIQLSAERAMDRLVTRDDPKVPKGLQVRPGPVQVKVRIDEKGAVTVTDAQSIDPTIRRVVTDAARTWKFLPATLENETRCVDTQIPIVLP